MNNPDNESKEEPKKKKISISNLKEKTHNAKEFSKKIISKDNLKKISDKIIPKKTIKEFNYIWKISRRHKIYRDKRNFKQIFSDCLEKPKHNDMWNELFNKKITKTYRTDRIALIRKILKENGFVKSFKIFNIVGTNGKSTVAKYLVDSFKANGQKVGLFSTPHLHKPNERIMVDGKKITNTQFFTYSKKMDLSFSETLFVVAMLHFQRQNIDIAFIESNIEDKFNSTKAINGDYGVVTSIGQNNYILDKTLDEIAQEKAEIINDNMKFFWPSSIDSTMMHHFGKNITIIENNSINYKHENEKLATGILDIFNIKPVIKDIEARTEILKYKSKRAIVDIASNRDAISASAKYLKNQKIEFHEVVISINKNRKIKDLQSIFKHKKIRIYTPSDEFYSGADLGFEQVSDLKKFVKLQKYSTLYIGTFKIISFVKKYVKSQNHIKEVLFGQLNSGELKIMHISIAALLIGLMVAISAINLKTQIFPTINVFLDFPFFIVFGLFFGCIWGSGFAIIADTLCRIVTGDLALWIWESAIIPPIAVLISSLFKSYIWNIKDKWILSVILVFVITDLLALITVIINNITSTNSFTIKSLALEILSYAGIFLLIPIQIFILMWYVVSKKKIALKRVINLIALIFLILVILSWLWGPVADLQIVKKQDTGVDNIDLTLKNKYLVYLLPKIMLTLPATVIWTSVLLPVYKVMNHSFNQVNSNTW